MSLSSTQWTTSRTGNSKEKKKKTKEHWRALCSEQPETKRKNRRARKENLVNRVQSLLAITARCEVKTHTLSNTVNNQKLISQFSYKKEKINGYMGVPYHITRNSSRSRSLKDANSGLDWKITWRIQHPSVFIFTYREARIKIKSPFRLHSRDEWGDRLES